MVKMQIQKLPVLSSKGSENQQLIIKKNVLLEYNFTCF